MPMCEKDVGLNLGEYQEDDAMILWSFIGRDKAQMSKTEVTNRSW